MRLADDTVPTPLSLRDYRAEYDDAVRLSRWAYYYGVAVADFARLAIGSANIRERGWP